MRGLAGRTQASTSEIGEVIDKLKVSSEQAVIAMEKSQNLAEILVEQSGIAETSFDDVNEAVFNISQMNEQIADSVKDQRATTNEINRNISAIAESTNECATGSSQTAEASQELASLTVELKTLVREFKI